MSLRSALSRASSVLAALVITFAGLVASPVQAVTATTPAPTLPEVIEATESSVTLVWSEPSDGGAAITDYLVQYRAVGSAEWVTFNDGISTDPVVEITGLAQSTTYEFRVGATNSVGTGWAQPQVIAIGEDHACMLLTGDTVVCWGQNDVGQLGNSTLNDSSTPLPVSGLSSVSNVVASGDTTCALLIDQTVKCWGSNEFGALGNGSLDAFSASPVTVTGLSSVVSIAVGGGHACAVLVNETVKCWGSNLAGQLGDGTTTNSRTPVTVAGLTGAVSVTAGGAFTCAMVRDLVESYNNAMCWGANTQAQLGYAPNLGSSSVTPVLVAGLIDVTDIQAGDAHVCAVSSSVVYCWGANTALQVKSPASSYVVSATGLADVLDVVTLSVGGSFACSLVTGAKVKCWGSNEFGQLGTDSDQPAAAPAELASLENVISVTTGTDSACAMLQDETVRCWGANDHSQLGNRLTSSSPIPTAFTAFAVEASTTARPNGIRVSLGDRTATSITLEWQAPVLDGGAQITDYIVEYRESGDSLWMTFNDGVSTETEAVVTGLSRVTSYEFRVFPVTSAGTIRTNVVQVTQGEQHACALLASGKVACWGTNADGQLGNATQISSEIPVFVQGISTATEIQAGSAFTCALLADKSVECWGANTSGQLGNGSFVSSTTPVAVSGLTGVASLAVGQTHACAIVEPTPEYELSTVQCWGSNSAGQLGNNSESNNSNVPSVVEGLDGVTSLTAGSDFTCAAVDGGDIRCWGYNDDGQLGNGSVNAALLPLNVSGATGAVQLSAGNHACAVVAGNAVKCWGPNSYGEIGKGTTSLHELTAQSAVRFPNVAHVEAAAGFTCVLQTNGDIKCLGLNNQGQLGNGTTQNEETVALLVNNLPSAVQFDSYASSSCALTVSDGVYCWGSNSGGQLGATEDFYSESAIQVGYFLEAATFETLAEKASAVTVTVGSKTATSVELSWTLPADDGGSSLVDYRIEYSTNSGTNWTRVNDGELLTRSYTVTGLAVGNYLFRVAGVTADQIGNYGTTSAVAVTGVVVPAKPGKATSVKGVTSAAKTLKFSWKAATNSPTAYEYRVWVTGKVKPALWKSLAGKATSVTVKGLKKNSKYSFEIRAKNASGTGASTTISSVKVTK